MNPPASEPEQPTPVYTVGHSNRSLAELREVLLAHAVQGLVDIRRFPRSRTHPQFNGDTLEHALREAQIDYVYFEALGGRRNKLATVAAELNAGWQVRAFHNYADYANEPAFQDALGALIARSQRQRCAIMCAEAVWWRCHRRIVSDHLLAHGVPVVHLFTVHKAEPAKLTPFAQVGAQARVTYPAAETGL